MDLSTFFLYLSLAGALLGGVGTVAARSPIRSAVSLLFTMLALAASYALLSAHLMAVFQVLIYAGAIIILIVYVIMLLDLKSEDAKAISGPIKMLAPPLVLIIGAMFYAFVFHLPEPAPAEISHDFGTVAYLGEGLLGRYLLSFEATSVLLLGAIVGAIYLTQPHNQDKPAEEGEAR